MESTFLGAHLQIRKVAGAQLAGATLPCLPGPCRQPGPQSASPRASQGQAPRRSTCQRRTSRLLTTRRTLQAVRGARPEQKPRSSPKKVAPKEESPSVSLSKPWHVQARRATAAALTAVQVLAPFPFEYFFGAADLEAGQPAAVQGQAQQAPGSGQVRPFPQVQLLGAAEAVLLSPDTKVPKNAQVALRRAVPVVNEGLRKIQNNLEDIFVLLRIPQRKPYGTMEGNVKKSIEIAVKEEGALLAAVPADKADTGKALLKRITQGEKDGLPGLQQAIALKDPDLISIRLANTLDNVTALALLQAPGLPFTIPAKYADYARLAGRATVELAVLKGDGSTFAIENGAASTATGIIQVVLDGYSAPLTSGNFARLVANREYDGVAVKSTTQAVLADARDAAQIRASAPELPLELMPSGEFQPVYRTPLEVSDGELPVLPMSVYGALVMAHSPESDSLNSPSQFFFYLYDKRNSGLGGLAFDEGQFSVFGYVVEGKDILAQLRTGDVIQTARLVSGADKLVVPGGAPSTQG